MCRLCDMYADGHKKWFLNPATYARRLYKIRRVGAEPLAPPPRTMGRDILGRAFLEAAERDDRETMNKIKSQLEDTVVATHFCQIVTLEEVLQIFDMVYPIVLFPCPCRRVMTGRPEDTDWTCINYGPTIYKWERWPEGWRELQFVHPDEAKDIITKINKKGLVQMVGTFGLTGEYAVGHFGQPFAAGMCSCDYPDCVFIRVRLEYDWQPFLWKGHEVARLNPELCNGCGDCVARCQFRALNYMATRNKVFIDMHQCFGCGQCASVCRQDAIAMVERSTLPALAAVW